MWEYKLSHGQQKIANYKEEPPSIAEVLAFISTKQRRYALPSKEDMLVFI
jgi:hypothetical protein